ncbi:hypothetical protein NKR23_g889 [Pleurostoma richardsiae]|uniref:GPI anchored serine-threonine rich protein n=1 Tax=Pleurostoma richardsiae TaxID=41990 RepID=A0AA38VWS9_9PEZI|nr:hypothetical protein NKR23_g889 [Pleurostoma richardsiae]
MKAAIFSLAALLAAGASAATATDAASAATTSCAADYIVETCLDTENNILASCGTNDYNCECAAYQAIVTCFNNCPDDQRKSQMEGQVTLYCGLASQYPSSTTSVAKATATGSTSAAGTTDAAAAATTTTGSGTATATGTASTSSSSAAADSGAGLVAMHAGGLLAVVGGAVAALL